MGRATRAAFISLGFVTMVTVSVHAQGSAPPKRQPPVRPKSTVTSAKRAAGNTSADVVQMVKANIADDIESKGKETAKFASELELFLGQS